MFKRLRPRLLAILIGTLFSQALSAADTQSFLCDTSPILIQNARLLEAPDKLISIYIENGQINWIGTPPQSAAQPKGRIVDAGGAYALPGFIDSHTHFDTLGGGKKAVQISNIQTEIFPVTMRQTLASGITTTRLHLTGLADMPLMAKLGNDTCFPGPRISLSAPGLIGGLPNLEGRLMRGVTSPEDAANKIAEIAQLGADWLALHRIEHFSEDELASIIDAANNHKLRLMADTDSFPALERALEAGILSAEYLNRTTEKNYPTTILNKIKNGQTLYSVAPIGYYYRAYMYSQQNTPQITENVLSFTPTKLTTAIRSDFPTEFLSDKYIERTVRSYPTLPKKFAALRNAGAIQLIGTDAGSTGHFHHDAIWWEFNAWKAFGIAPVQILKAATTLPAMMLGENSIGSLAPGKQADIVLYSGNYAMGEYNRDKVQTVIKGGIVFVENHKWIGPERSQTISQIKSHITKD